MRRSTTIVGVATITALTGMMVPAQADRPLTGQELVPAVTRVHDVRVFVKNSRGEQAPHAGTGAEYIADQGICAKASGRFAVLGHLSHRQAWSTQLIGGGESRGLITIVGQYRSRQAAKAKLARVLTLLSRCPARVHDGSRRIRQSYGALASMFKGRAVWTYELARDSQGQDSVQYVAIRQTGALLSFVRYSQVFTGRAPKGTQFRGMVDYLSGKVAERYAAIS